MKILKNPFSFTLPLSILLHWTTFVFGKGYFLYETYTANKRAVY